MVGSSLIMTILLIIITNMEILSKVEVEMTADAVKFM